MIKINNNKYENIYLVTAKTSTELAKVFIRFQEYYESPEFKNQIFTIKQFKKWYKSIYGKFSYYLDWVGFNISDYVLIPFIEKQFKRLTKEEKKLIRYFKYKPKPFYIIGTPENDANTLLHELAHAFFYLNEDYRNICFKLINSFEESLLNKINTKLREMGYDDSVLIDETQAYLVEDSSYLDFINLTPKQTDLIKELKNIINK